MENYLNENFDSVQPKNPSEDALRRWRSAVGLVKNRRRRFRRVADLVKRSEAEKKKLKIQEKIRVGLLVQNAARQYMGKSDLEEESLIEHLPTEAAEAGRNQESVDDVGSTDNRKSVSKLLDKYKKCALALFYVLLEAASLSLDIAGKMKWRILLAAFVLSAFSFAISMYTCIMRRTRAATRVHWQTQLVRMALPALLWPQLLILNCRIYRTWKQTAACLRPQLQTINCRISRFITQVLLLRTWKQTAACLWPHVQTINCRISRFITQVRLLRMQKQTAAYLWPQLLVSPCGRFICQIILAMRMQKQTAACLYW